MNDTKQFLVVKQGVSNLLLLVLDKQRKKVIKLENGLIIDNTENCKKLYDKELKAREKHKDGRTMGSLYYQYVLGLKDRTDCIICKDDILLDTDNLTELDSLIFKSLTDQINFRLQYINASKSKLENDKQYYTYEFSNC